MRAPLVGLILLQLLPLAGCRATAQERPNIVLVVADDLDLRSARRLDFYRRLAARGVEFQQHVTRTPVCSPSRASLLTGIGYERHGVGFGGPRTQPVKMEEQAARSLGPLLHAVGYRTMLAGKYVNRAECSPGAAGWDEWVVLCRAPSDEIGYRVTDNGRRLAPQSFQTDFLRDRGLEFLRQSGERPAFLYVAPSHLHRPAPRHADADVPAFAPPPSFQGDRASAEQTYLKRMRTMLALGELVEALLHQLESEDRPWLLILTSDNGVQQGEHGTSGKNVVYEESVRVPLLILGSDLPRGVRDRQTIHEDVAATVLQAAGLPIDGLDGGDLLSGTAHERVTIRGKTSTATRTTLEKRIEWSDGRVETFDLVGDPYEIAPRAP